jgi:hypothetical protein
VPAFHAVAVTIAARWTSNVLGILSPRSAKVEPTGKPTFDPDDRTIPVVFGTRWVSPVNLWYGDLAMRREGKITATNTRGYAWLLGWHQGLAFAPIDGIVKIRIAGTRPSLEQPVAGMIWDPLLAEAPGDVYHEITANETIWVLNNYILGGGYAEGGSGLGGDLDVLFGADDQIENAYLQSRLGTDIPAYRGILSAVYYNSVTGLGGLAIQNSDEIPAWEYLLRRQVAGAGIGTYDMAGSSIVTRAPCGSRLAMRIAPPWASTMFLTIPRPSPVPLSLVVKNGSQIFSARSAGMPGPASSISMQARPPSARRPTPMRPPSGMACIALMKRLRRDWCSRGASPMISGSGFW